MANAKRAILDLYYAAAQGRAPSAVDMRDADIPTHLHDRVRREARDLLADYYSREDKTWVRHEAQRLGTALASNVPSAGASGHARDDMVRMPTLNGKRHPVASMYLQIAERGGPSTGLLDDAGIPEELRDTVREHATHLRQLWESGDQEAARQQGLRYANEVVDALGGDYQQRPAEPVPDDPRALAAMVRAGSGRCDERGALRVGGDSPGRSGIPPE
jgi:hypothetical protein